MEFGGRERGSGEGGFGLDDGEYDLGGAPGMADLGRSARRVAGGHWWLCYLIRTKVGGKLGTPLYLIMRAREAAVGAMELVTGYREQEEEKWQEGVFVFGVTEKGGECAEGGEGEGEGAEGGEEEGEAIEEPGADGAAGTAAAGALDDEGEVGAVFAGLSDGVEEVRVIAAGGAGGGVEEEVGVALEEVRMAGLRVGEGLEVLGCEGGAGAGGLGLEGGEEGCGGRGSPGGGAPGSPSRWRGRSSSSRCHSRCSGPWLRRGGSRRGWRRLRCRGRGGCRGCGGSTRGGGSS